MKIGILKEHREGERRVAVSPTIAKAFIAKGFECLVEEGAGFTSSYNDADYENVGTKVLTQKEVFDQANLLVKINPFIEQEIAQLKEGQVTISTLYHMSHPELVEALMAK
ncbi:MAG: NAD(P)(+) transhydrogenase (Re/Si-specific) subunit alpha, partial [Flavobacteriaceae bacterium]|nr:NAD(P)(+) transhydrogenase (Re/Si-specific) subunit alpha [Flavobacteriaceae bacterium]